MEQRFLPLRVPTKPAFLLGIGGLGGAARLFQQEYLEVDESEPSGIGNVVVVAAL